MVEALKNADSDLRLAAVKGLDSIGTKSCLSGLLASCHDLNATIRRESAKALGRLGSEKALDRLNELHEDKVAVVRTAANNAIFRIKRH